MLRRMMFASLFSLSLVAQDIQIIDLAQKNVSYAGAMPDLSTARGAFNGAIEMAPFFALLQKEYNVSVAVETGTYYGGTTTFFAQLFSDVHTIELDKVMYERVKDILSPLPNIQCHWGSSSDLLPEILDQHKEDRALFYLDAHGANTWPLLAELQIISKTHKDNCIVVIDDFQVPGRPEIPYDHWEGKSCGYEYVKDGLNAVFSEYECMILVPKNPMCKAKMVAFPKGWGVEALSSSCY